MCVCCCCWGCWLGAGLSDRSEGPDQIALCAVPWLMRCFVFFFFLFSFKEKKNFFFCCCSFCSGALSFISTARFLYGSLWLHLFLGLTKKKIGSIFYYWSTFCFYIAREKASSAGMNEPPRLLMMRFNFKSLFVQKKKKKREAKQHQTRKEWLLLERVEGGGREREECWAGVLVFNLKRIEITARPSGGSLNADVSKAHR